jgi:hypothetical protein
MTKVLGRPKAVAALGSPVQPLPPLEATVGYQADWGQDELEKAVNIGPSLEPSKYVKSRTNGTIHLWTQVFADQPEEFANCDEEGREERQYWEDQKPDWWAARMPDLTAPPPLEREEHETDAPPVIGGHGALLPLGFDAKPRDDMPRQ